MSAGKFVVCSQAGGGVFAEDKKAKCIRKYLPGETLSLPKDAADALLERGVIKPFAPPKEEPSE